MPFSVRGTATLLAGGFLAVMMIGNFQADRTSQSTQGSDQDLIGQVAGDAAAAGRSPSLPQDLAEARKHSLARLRDEPLDSWPLSMLAFLAAAGGDRAETDRVRALLLDRTKRDVATLVWSVDHALRTGDAEAALKGLDLISRLNAPTEIRDRASAALVTLAREPASRAALVGQLKQSPGWRQSFLGALASTGAPGVFPDLMQALQDEKVPSANPAWRIYLQRLMAIGDGAGAYAAWVGLQPPDRLKLLGNVFDGTFATPPDGTAFDWSLAGNSGIAASFATGEGQNGLAALRIEFSGTRVPAGLASQSMVLAPGAYRLSGHLRYERLETERGLAWQVYCVDGDNSTLIGDSGRVSGDHDWMPFLADFEVPAARCPTQRLQLTLPARIAVEQVIRGRFWTDGVSVDRADAAPLTR